MSKQFPQQIAKSIFIVAMLIIAAISLALLIFGRSSGEITRSAGAGNKSNKVEAYKSANTSIRVSANTYTNTSTNCPIGIQYLGETGVIRQSTPYDCGPACIQMILNKHGVNANNTQIRSIAGTDKDGTSISGIKKALSSFGINVSARVLSLDEVDRIGKPFIAYINRSHFVIVDSVTPDGCLIVLDPSGGKLLYNRKYFNQQWTGEAITYQ